ncbi:DUF4126 domain-containing protein [Sphingomonas glaciei]|uniref:DUF4126 domain-containing protein n=1 Tax=Sphingomonas glaciei TaxID=2938948 RepID=A0ABY5MUW0_9SPHN|nr:DUF4126 domain-containing protein [Sphingomonas glaciei]UUR07097.1 DUF4126 domain-containing protein [Sphingomonas glaciei]
MLPSILIGALSGQRALTPIAAVAITAARDRLPDGSKAVPLLDNKLVAGGLLAVAVAEMVGDKWPKSPNRTVLSGSTARFITAAAAGASLAPRDQRVAGGLLAALTAVTTAHLGLAARLRSMQRWSQARTGFVEDALLLAGTALLIHQVARPARAAA